MKDLDILKSFAIIASVVLGLLVPVVAEAQNVIPIPPHNSIWTGSFSRGLWFTAPCDFTITGVRAPADYSSNAQSIHLVRLSSPVASHPALSTVFTTLYYGSNITDTGFVDLNVQVNAGDYIGILAIRDNGSGMAVSSYTAANGPITSTIGAHSVQLFRFGWQGNIINSAATNFWTEPGLPIGRAEIRYTYQQPATLPLPPHNSVYPSQSRGFWFTAPCDFNITGVRAPVEINTNPQTIQVVKFPAPPANHPTLTTTFTTLYYGSNISGTNYVGMNIEIKAGDHIGIMAVRDNGSGNTLTSYTSVNSPVTINLGSNSLVLHRLGYQGNIIPAPAPNFWTESSLPIGRADIRFEMPTNYVYSPASLIGNTIPFSNTAANNNKRQVIYHPADFSCIEPGYINKIYLKASGSVNSTITDLLIRMGTTNLFNQFTTNSFVTNLDTVLFAQTIGLSSINDNWIPFTLQTPFYYDGTSNLILEVSHQGYTTGFLIMQAIISGRSIFGNSASTTGATQDRVAAVIFSTVKYLDASLEAFDSLQDTVCEGLLPVSVILKNNSPATINYATINWKVNNLPQPVFNWSGTLPPGGSNSVHIGNYSFSQGTTYNIEAIVSEPNGLVDRVVYNDTVKLTGMTVAPLPSVSLGNDTSIASSASIILDAGPGFSSYLWSTGHNSQVIITDSSGVGVGIKTIWVEVKNQYSCPASDTIKISFVEDIGLEEMADNPYLKIIPNPSDGTVNLIVHHFTQGTVNVKIFARDGTKVHHSETQIFGDADQIKLDLQHLADGIYLINISSKEGALSGKLIIVR